MKRLSIEHAVWATFAIASLILAYHPLHWLARSWISPAYDSHGYIYVLAIAGLVARSLLSGPPTGARPLSPVIGLLVLAAAIRLVGQVLAINIASALALAVDVYALAALLRLRDRPFALSPLWMAVLFVFSLPVETVLQRALGYPLQLISAELSCFLLGAAYDDVACQGVRITVDGLDVLVDLPCSGASGLLLTLAFFVGLNTINRPQLRIAALAGLGVLGLAVIGNSLRVTMLAAGLTAGWDMMAEPWHSAIGVLTLALTLAPLALWYRPTPAPRRILNVDPPNLPASIRLIAGGALIAGAAAIVSQSPQPVDVSGELQARALPVQLAGLRGEKTPLAPIEQAYFQTYGGDAQKAQFGPLGLNIVSTTSPLRHLHAPEICLRGMGYRVRFLGTRFEGTASAIYRAESPDGEVWRVAVSYASDAGDVTPSVGEAIWRWMTGRGGSWSSVQRITPWSLGEGDRARLEAAALAALDISTPTEGI